MAAAPMGMGGSCTEVCQRAVGHEMLGAACKSGTYLCYICANKSLGVPEVDYISEYSIIDVGDGL